MEYLSVSVPELPVDIFIENDPALVINTNRVIPDHHGHLHRCRHRNRLLLFQANSGIQTHRPLVIQQQTDDVHWPLHAHAAMAEVTFVQHEQAFDRCIMQVNREWVIEIHFYNAQCIITSG